MSHKLRSRELTQAYKDYRKVLPVDAPCALCEKEPLQAFTYWKIIENKFPYDLITETHHMIVPIAHKTEYEITSDEWLEYKTIKQTVTQDYDYFLEATSKLKSIPEHFHIHLLITKDLLAS